MGDTVRVETLADHTTDGEPHKTGDHYEAPAGAVDYLIAHGLATPAPPESSPPPPAKSR